MLWSSSRKRISGRSMNIASHKLISPVLTLIVFATLCGCGESNGSDESTCEAGLLDCGTLCVDPMTDPANCGACGVACSEANGESCVEGACACIASTRCGDVCADLGTDPANCGECGVACNEENGQICADGSCGCGEGFHDGGDGACVASGACSEGYGIPDGGEDCILLEDVCSDDDPCNPLAGWSDGACRYEQAPDGTGCTGEDPDPCVTGFECLAGICAPLSGICTQPRPIVFVHGVNGSSANFFTMSQRLIDDGWPEDLLFFFDAADPAWGCNVDNAEAIRLLVDSIIETTCQPRVDIVAHSMGTMSSRYYIKNLGGTEHVNTYVTLGGMHHGLRSPCLAPDFLGVCVWQELCETGDFITQLNADPATPGELYWVTMYGKADSDVPNASSMLSGAENIEFEGVEHSGSNGLLEVEEVYEEVRRVLEYPCL